MASIPDFLNLKQIVFYLQTISLPESYYLYLDNWSVYFIALFGILLVGIIFHLLHLLLKLHFFRSMFNSSESLAPLWEFKNFFYAYFVIFILFGVFIGVFDLPIPDMTRLSWQIVFAVIFVLCSILTVVTVFSEHDRGFGIERNLKGKILNVAYPVCLCFFASLTAFAFASMAVPSDLNMVYGYISSDAEHDYKIGDTAPISVQIGGPDTGLSAILLRDEISGSTEISSLTLFSNNSATQFNDTLVGDVLGPGDYIITLNNTISLPAGHYKLVLENPKYTQINSTIPFFLTE